MKVAVVAEYYPRAADPVLGVWAHRQALAARDAGADVRVLVLHRPIPSRAALKSRSPRALLAPLRQPLHAELDGLQVHYVPFLAPPRPRTYGSWSALGGAAAAARAAPAAERLRLRPRPRALRRPGRRRGPPRARRARRWSSPSTAATCSRSRRRSRAGDAAVRAGLAHARARARQLARDRRRAAATLGARDARVVHLGTDLPPTSPPERGATARHRRPPGRAQAPRRRPARAVAAPRRPSRRALGRDRRRARAPAARAPRRGARARPAASASSGSCRRPTRAPPPRRPGVFVLPSVDEAFGVAYVEAMAGAVPAIGCRGEAGPEEIAAVGRRDAARRARRSRGARARAARCCSTSRAGARARRRRARHRRGRLHLGALRARDRRRLRGRAPVSDPRPVLLVTNHAPAFRIGAFQALHEREDVVFALVGGELRHGGGAAATPFPALRPPQRAVGAARRVGPLPRRRRGALRPRRAPGRVPRRAPGARAVRALGDDLAPSAHAPRTRCRTSRSATSTATRTPSPPTGRT